jgi:hypothetical protein
MFTYSPVYPLLRPTQIPFYAPQIRIDAAHHFYLNLRSALLLLGFASHLASALTFLFLAALNQLGWRLKQLAALRQLNKPWWRPSFRP